MKDKQIEFYNNWKKKLEEEIEAFKKENSDLEAELSQKEWEKEIYLKASKKNSSIFKEDLEKIDKELNIIYDKKIASDDKIYIKTKSYKILLEELDSELNSK